MKLFMMVLFILVVGYFTFHFLLLLIKMKQNILLPITMEEKNVLRRFPKRPIGIPSFSEQKWGILIYSLVLLFLIIMFILAALKGSFRWSYFLLLFLLLNNTNNLLNTFAFVEEGIISGSRFIPWRKIKSYHFNPIDKNHKFYGYDKEVNAGYELKIKTNGFSTYCIVTSEEVKERIGKLINDHISQ